MLPVTISLGLINFNQLINSLFGSLVCTEAPAAIEKAFRIYQLPQGIFSVAVATVLFPTLARFANAGEIDNLRATMANGIRQILFVLLPAAAMILALSDPMIRLSTSGGNSTRPRRRSSPLRSSGSPSRCRQTASICCRRGPSSASSVPGRRPALARSTSSSRSGRAFILDKSYGVAGIVAGTGIGTRRRCSPRPHPAAASSAASSRSLLSSDGAGNDRLGGAGRGSVGSFGNALEGELGNGLGGQIISLGLVLGAGGIAYLSRSRTAAHPRAGADRPAAAARAVDARSSGAICWELSSSPLLVGRRASARLGSALAPASPGRGLPSSPLATGRLTSRHPDLGGRDLGTAR